jgi:hypothetical protein
MLSIATDSECPCRMCRNRIGPGERALVYQLRATLHWSRASSQKSGNFPRSRKPESPVIHHKTEEGIIHGARSTSRRNLHNCRAVAFEIEPKHRRFRLPRFRREGR